MDAEQALAFLRARNRYIRQLPSGLWARIALPRAGDAMASGEFPMPVLREMAKLAQNGAAEHPEDVDVSPETIQHLARYRNGLVLRALKGLSETEAGLEEDVNMSHDVVDELEQDDFDQIFRWADRQDAIDPKAESSMSEPSPDLPDLNQAAP